MKTLYAAIDTVYDHTVGVTLAYVHRIVSSGSETPVLELGSAYHDDVASKKIEQSESSSTHEIALPTFRAVSTLLDERSISQSDLTRTVAYVGSARAPLFATPTKEFDTVITTLPYGAMVMVLEEKGRFSKVAQNGVTGWMLRDDLSDRAAYVYPDFRIGEANRAGDPNTERLRAVIGDIFHGGESEVPLQAGEYVTYKLFRKGATINWPPTRPRTPGRWQLLLQGTPGVHIGTTPKSGGIMEYTLEHDIGHLAYVEAVFPDERITISEVNNPSDGIYSERTIPRDVWQLMNPVFIHIP